MNIKIKKNEIETLKSDIWRCAKNQDAYLILCRDIDLASRKYVSQYMGRNILRDIEECIYPEYQEYFKEAFERIVYIDMEY